MTDQTQRLEIATVRAEIGSNITFRFNNDAIDAGGIPTESGDIKNLKLIIKEIEDKASVSSTIYPSVAAGLAATSEGGMFLVISDQADEIYVVWKKVSGAAVDTGKRTLSSQAIEDAMISADASADLAADSAIEAQSAAASLTGLSDSTDPLKGAGLVARLNGGTVQDAFIANDASKGAAVIPYKKSTLYGRFKNSAHVSDWTILGADLVTTPDNEGAKLAQAVAEVAAGNGTLLFDNRNYLTDRTLIASGAFRSFRLQGAGVGNSQTAGTGGTTILTSGGYRAFRAEFNTFANENCRIEGLNFNNMAQNTSDYEAISIVRGSANGRYISGFIFKDVGITGFGAGISWQGMNTIDSGLNYFGTTIIDNVHVSDTGAGLALSNCSLNLLDIRSTVFHTCPQGGIRLLRDGAVGAGNGRGSSITAHISGKSHFENVAGMFRTQTTRTFGGTGTSAYLRSTIHMDGLLHEFCGSSIGPTSGDPFVLGVDTDIIVTGDVNYGPGYGEASVPLINPSNTITSSSPIMVIMNGGISKSPMMVNAPKIRRSVINTGSTNFTIVAPASANFALRSRLILGDGLLGIIESVHNGNSSGTKYTTSTTPQPSSGASGVTVSFSAGSAGNVIFCSVTNNSGTTIAIELQVDNYSHTTISTPSESF